MEADWEFDADGDAPVIDGCWAGFVDLRPSQDSSAGLPSLASNLPEVVQFPALAAVLERLNAPGSQVWTAKCDFWPVLKQEDFDPDELDAADGKSAHAAGCYIDLLPASRGQWKAAPAIEQDCKRLCGCLHAVALRNCRCDLVIRHARVEPDVFDLGITAYFTACGATVEEVRHTLHAALASFADACHPCRPH
jgi:hypothetical protein